MAAFVKILKTDATANYVGSWTKILLVEFFVCHPHAARLHLTGILAVGLAALLVQEQVLVKQQLLCLLLPTACPNVVAKGSGAQIAAELARQRAC